MLNQPIFSTDSESDSVSSRSSISYTGVISAGGARTRGCGDVSSAGRQRAASLGSLSSRNSEKDDLRRTTLARAAIVAARITVFLPVSRVVSDEANLDSNSASSVGSPCSAVSQDSGTPQARRRKNLRRCNSANGALPLLVESLPVHAAGAGAGKCSICCSRSSCSWVSPVPPLQPVVAPTGSFLDASLYDADDEREDCKGKA